jgi:hypothetical protein
MTHDTTVEMHMELWKDAIAITKKEMGGKYKK